MSEQRPEVQVSQPDAEDQEYPALTGEEVEDPFPETWPDEDQA